MLTDTQPSRWAAATVATLAMVHLVTALTGDLVPPYARVILLGASSLGALAAVVLLRRNSFGSRVVAATVAGLSAAGAVLVGAVGLPGGVPSGLAGTSALVVSLALATALLLVLDVRLRPASVSDRPPYAL